MDNKGKRVVFSDNADVEPNIRTIIKKHKDEEYDDNNDFIINNNDFIIKRKKEEEDEYNETINYPKKKRSVHDIISNNPMIYSINNEIHFTTGVNQESIENLIKEISTVISSAKDKTSKLEITYVIDTPGGCVYSALKFIDFIDSIRRKHPRITFRSVVTGLVASAGTIMAIVADKKYITKYGFAMIHELQTGHRGYYTHLMSRNENIIDTHDLLVKIYLENMTTVVEKSELEAIMQKETWYNAQKYVDAGFVDGIL